MDKLINKDELKVIADMVVGLTEVKINAVGHLCVEEFAAVCFKRLIEEYARAFKYKTTGNGIDIDSFIREYGRENTSK